MREYISEIDYSLAPRQRRSGWIAAICLIGFGAGLVLWLVD
jgi:hypothetical protein